jgi:hypothetical protein
MGAKNSNSKVIWELRAFWGVYTDFWEAFRKASCSSHVTLKQLLHGTGRGIKDISEIFLKYFARSKEDS